MGANNGQQIDFKRLGHTPSSLFEGQIHRHFQHVVAKLPLPLPDAKHGDVSYQIAANGEMVCINGVGWATVRDAQCMCFAGSSWTAVSVREPSRYVMPNVRDERRIRFTALTK